MEAGFQRVLDRLPFPICHLHPDNGPEFFNHHLVRFWGTEITGLTLSRSRPYQKNDHRFVEQKNATLVRAYLGHRRLDTAAQCATLDALYTRMGSYYNLFQPVLHLTGKEMIDGKVKRRWDDAQTPYQRVLTTGILMPTVGAGLAAWRGRRISPCVSRMRRNCPSPRSASVARARASRPATEARPARPTRMMLHTFRQ